IAARWMFHWISAPLHSGSTVAASLSDYCQQRRAIGLTKGVARNCSDHLQVLRDLIICQVISDRVEDLVHDLRSRVILQLHKSRHTLSEDPVRYPNDGSVSNRGMGGQDMLDFNRRNIRSSADDKVF